MLPPAVTNAAIESELPGTMAWAERHQIVIDTRLRTERIIRLVLVQEDEAEKFYLQGKFDDYRALPPIWEWCNETWAKSSDLTLCPNPHENPFGSTFIQHNNKGIICAPFNRLAYGTYGGPHQGWGDLAQWMTTETGHIHAVTIGDMLQSILRDFRFTRGRMR